MREIGPRQLSTILLAAAMSTVGVAGISGHLDPTPQFGVVLFVVAISLAFSAGRTSTELWR